MKRRFKGGKLAGYAKVELPRDISTNSTNDLCRGFASVSTRARAKLLSSGEIGISLSHKIASMFRSSHALLYVDS